VTRICRRVATTVPTTTTTTPRPASLAVPPCTAAQASAAGCLNGATCINDADYGTGICMCRAGFLGTRCEQRVNHCEINLCRNSAPCASAPRNLVCTCPAGFTGQFCNIRTSAATAAPPSTTTRPTTTPAPTTAAPAAASGCVSSLGHTFPCINNVQRYEVLHRTLVGGTCFKSVFTITRACVAGAMGEDLASESKSSSSSSSVNAATIIAGTRLFCLSFASVVFVCVSKS
jgi:hypothetical protein